MRKKFMSIGLSLLMLAMAFDICSTMLALSSLVEFQEKNPYMHWLLEKGPYYFVAIKLLQQLTFILIIWAKRETKLALFGTIILLSAHLPLIIWHIRLWQHI